MIGPVEVAGWDAPEGRELQLQELLSYLVLHRERPVRGGVLRLALRPDEADEISEETLHTYVSRLRRAISQDRFPRATRAGYRLADAVTSDWDRFQQLAGPDAERASLERALSLVRGRPFAGVPEGAFGWVHAELLVSEIEVAVARAAKRCAAMASDVGDHEGAGLAVRQGLMCAPYDYELWALHLSLAARRGPGALARARKEAEADVGEDARALLVTGAG